jgi:uncharacterized membrane protein (DUF373 family)
MADRETDLFNVMAVAIGRVESAIYLIAALFLIIMAILAFFYVAGDLLGVAAGTAGRETVYTALNDLLVVLIIVELIQTIIEFVQRHELDLRLVLAAGLTATIRRVLLLGVEKISYEEMGITALLIVSIAVAIYLVGYQKVERPS